MTLPTHVPAREPLSDILRIAARCGLELLGASLLVFACIRRRGVALPSRNPLPGAPSTPTMPNPFRPVRATFCPGLFSTAHAGPLPYISRARAMGVSGGVRSGDGARRPRPARRHPCGQAGRLETRYREPLPPYRHRTAAPHVSRDTFRARVMGLSGGVRSGDGPHPPGQDALVPPGPINHGNGRSFRSVPAFPTGG